MFTSAQAIADAKANTKPFLALGLAGALIGASLAAYVTVKTLPDEEVRNIPLTVPNALAIEGVRFSGDKASPWAAIRSVISTQYPDSLEQLDSIPAQAGWGALAGFFMFPLAVASLLAWSRKRASTPKDFRRNR